MEFYVFDPEIDRIEATVFDRDLFSPNGEHQLFLNNSTLITCPSAVQIFSAQQA